MTYASFRRLPSINNYAGALARTKVTPIRGSSPLSYPLAERRDHRSFSIRLVEASGDVELMLYSKPVITFHKPREGQAERLTIRQSYSYWSAADCHFIYELLPRFVACASTSKGRLVIKMRDDSTIVIPRGKDLTLTLDHEARTLKPTAPELIAQTVLRLNRARANAVRARYGEFFRYLKGMVGVRKQDTEFRFKSKPYHIVTFSAEELASVVPMETEETIQGLRSTVPLTKVRYARKYAGTPLDRKPPRLNGQYLYDEAMRTTLIKYDETPYKRWLANTQEFLALCSTPAQDPEQFEKFRQAFVWLGFYIQAPHTRAGYEIKVEAKAMSERFNEIIFKYHSEEVFERVPAKPNSVPSMKYEEWVTREKG